MDIRISILSDILISRVISRVITEMERPQTTSKANDPTIVVVKYGRLSQRNILWAKQILPSPLSENLYWARNSTLTHGIS